MSPVMSASARACVLLLSAVLAGCKPEPVPFECTSDDQCTVDDDKGRCELSGYCSLSDTTCDSGRRYAELAGDGLAEQCVKQCVLGLSLGNEHSCALLHGGKVACWGNGRDGRLGHTGADGAVPTPVQVDESLPTVSAISAGGKHGCALSENGSAWCWGDNSSLQLGQPGGGPAPTRIEALDGAGVPVTQVAAGGAHSCVRTSVGTGCAGNNTFGQLGQGNVSAAAGPDLVAFTPGFQEVATGTTHTCGRTIAGTVHCWGDNATMQVGAALPEPYPQPEPVQTPMRAASLALGMLHSCMINSNEEVACWGNNLLAGQLGRPQALQNSATPLVVNLPAAVTQVSAGATHSCALDVQGRAWCWGGNDFGQHGPGRPSTSPFEPNPVVVELPGGIVEIAVGGLHTCARTERDEVYCWGANEFGQLGNGKTDPDGQREPDPTVTASLRCEP
jgi:alpha-tubulin suppressor-like RCC1 family protein